MRPLTDVQYWEREWWVRERPRKLRVYRDFDFETVRLLRSAAGDGALRVLEIGAGGSRVLPYLARKDSHKVFGSDFSFRGCQLLRANLVLEGVEGDVVCEDLFNSALRDGTFDVVYSSGLIEHFEDTTAVIQQHLRVLKPGGRLVLIVPNFQGVQGRIVRQLAPRLWERHFVFGPEWLAGCLREFNLERVRSGYLGSFYVHVGWNDEWSGFRRWPAWLRLFVHYSVRFGNGLISLAFRLSPVRPHGRRLSPAFFAEGIKPKV